MNVIDKVVGWISPGAGLKRHYQRRQLSRAYEAASPGDTWRPRRQGASANADHMADASNLRGKARTLVQNVAYMRAGLEGLVSYTVGTGIVSRAVGAGAETFNNAFDAWSRVCDADGRLNWPGIQAAAYRAMEQDGEVLVRLRPRRPSDSLPIPLQIQLLEIDWLDAGRHGTVDGAEVINGIEYDRLGKPAAYWLFDRHPGDITTFRGVRSSSYRVPASNIIHMFAPERPGQGRGFSRFASVINRVRDLQLYEDAELARKNLEARLSVLASGDVTQMADGPPDAVSGNAAQTGELGDLAGGSIIGLPAGMTATVIEPKVAPGYVQYIAQNLQLIASGIGVPYHLMTCDLEKTSFSSGRIGQIDFRRRVEAMQWNVLIPLLIERVCHAALEAAVLSGLVSRSNRQFDHSPPKWEYVNPEDDVKAELLEISGGLTSPSEAMRRRGYTNFKAAVAEMARDFKTLEDAGVLPILMALQNKLMPGAQPPAAPPPAPRAELPSVHVHQAPVTVGSPVVNVQPAEVRMDAPVIHVAPAEVRVPAPEIRVEAAVVNLPAPVVNIAPAQVRVEAPAVTVNAPAPVVNVTTPRRRTDGIVERDKEGRVLRTTQIETDLPSGP